MSEDHKPVRLIKAAKEFNVGISTIVEFLSKKGFAIESKPNTKILPEMYVLLIQEFQSEKNVKEESQKIGLDFTDRETVSIDNTDVKHIVEEKEKEQEDLFIKNLQIDDNDTKIDESEEILKTKEEDTKKKEATKKDEPEKLEKKKEEKTKVKEEKKKEVKKEDKKKEDDKEEEKKLKVVGKVDLETLTPKPKTTRKKTTKKTKTDEEEKEVKEEAVKEEVKKEEPQKKVAEKEKELEEEVNKPKEEPEEITEEQAEILEEITPENFIPTEFEKLIGPKILKKIDLAEFKKPEKKPVASSSDDKPKKKKRKRIKKEAPAKQETKEEVKGQKQSVKGKDKRGRKEPPKPEVSEEEIQKQIKETLARLSPTGKSKASKHRRQKREQISQNLQKEQEKIEAEKKIIKVTEFVSASELATMIDVNVNEIISTCMSLGLFVSINQRLDAETIVLVAEEFGYKVEFVSVDVQEAIYQSEEEDRPEDNVFRSPIVTVMGHVDHGKTLLLDYIRKTNVIAGEAGGITQHIGAYEVALENDKKITFLDTPGHEAFTAMRARGAKVTDVAIIVIAADDSVMPQTVEAINHAQAAGVPIVFAITKIDKANANTEKIKEELSKINILVEDWGGKYQSQEISSKKGTGIPALLEKVLLEAELLDLKGNPKIMANGTVIESTLDKGRGYLTKVLVQNGTLRIGDMVLAGANYGKVKAMFNERNTAVKEAGPSTPVLMLGLNGAPQAGDTFNSMKEEKEAKSIAAKRLILQREQGLRTQKHITLDEIGRRIAIGDFKELNVIVKGDVDGSVEALSDSLLKLSYEEVQVNVIHKSVGQVTETDVMLASASNAIIIGFQVRPSLSARKVAEQEQIDIRLYSVIYKAIEEIKLAIEGMLSPDIEEKITCNIEVRDVFKITKVGTVAGCMVLDGKVTRNTKVRIIRDGIVIYSGLLGTLKRFKDDVKEVSAGYECGLNIENFNDIKVGDIIEGYEEIAVKRKLT